jgi:mercuric ion binding protein
MRYIIPLFILAVLVSGCQRNKPKTDVTVIRVKSVVCKKCVETITKALYNVEGVKDVEVDLEKKIATVTYVPLQTNIQTLEVTITDAGYDANDRPRDPDAYAKLDDCCKTEKQGP